MNCFTQGERSTKHLLRQEVKRFMGKLATPGSSSPA
ncbi:unnamed protein product [Acanthoscelides obtectus]|uniref:Uncharacterized protein n=1 Tax=Acanthoscelides obtectus TaxID=200917 RepID=A0A9P0MEY0_ACAOB|nr:unnamed protein product [Acanthoscelides obtectus]CAK1639323.1 hypothetical protein AOBTE_LOCUS11123 [Acanthoscelides obtectus]